MENELAYWQEKKAFYVVFQMKMMEKVSKFQKFQIDVWNHYILKKVDIKTFSFWTNGIFANKQALLNDCELILQK